MSDMNHEDVVSEPAAPAPAQPAPVVEGAPEAQQPEVPAAPEPVPVIAQQPSSEKQQPESAPVVEKVPISLEDAVRVMLIYVRAHRTVGDVDLDAAINDVEAALPPGESPAASPEESE